MGYDPSMIENSGGGRIEPGTYAYRVTSAEEKVFRSKNSGLELTLEVCVGSRVISVYERIPYIASCAWKIKKFAASAGFDPMRSPEPHQLVGMQGRAEFAKDAKGYLEVDEFLPKEDNTSAPSPTPMPTRAVVAAPAGDDVPF